MIFSGADEGRGAEAGWSFHLAAGAGYVVSNDQLQPNNGNERVRDLDDNANRFDRAIPLANWKKTKRSSAGSPTYTAGIRPG